MKYISLLRGINVGGNRKMVMSDLKLMYGSLGFSNAVSYIQSGNLLFDFGGDNTCAEIEIMIEQAISDIFGFDVPTIVLSEPELRDLITLNPLLQAEKEEGLHVTFLKSEPEKDRLQYITTFDTAPDTYKIVGRTVYVLCEGKYRDTKLSNQFFESKLKVQATTRNWKSVLKLLELAGN